MGPSILAVNLLCARVWCSRRDPRIAFCAAYVRHMILHHIHAQPLAQHQSLVDDGDWQALAVVIEASPRSTMRMARGRGPLRHFGGQVLAYGVPPCSQNERRAFTLSENRRAPDCLAPPPNARPRADELSLPVRLNPARSAYRPLHLSHRSLHRSCLRRKATRTPGLPNLYPLPVISFFDTIRALRVGQVLEPVGRTIDARRPLGTAPRRPLLHAERLTATEPV